MLPDEMEAEKNRKLLLAQADEIEIYRKNIRDLQAQLNSAQIHNKNLTQSLSNAYDDISRLAKDECFCGLADEPVMATEDI